MEKVSVNFYVRKKGEVYMDKNNTPCDLEEVLNRKDEFAFSSKEEAMAYLQKNTPHDEEVVRLNLSLLCEQ